MSSLHRPPDSTPADSEALPLVEKAVLRWRSALQRVIQGGLRREQTVRGIADCFGIGRGTAHNLARLMEAETLPSMVALLPGAKARESVVIRCRMSGSSEALQSELEAADERLNGVLDRFGLTRDRLAALVGDNVDDDELRRRLLRGFRGRFESDQLLIGAEASILIAAQIAVPSSDDIHVDIAGLQVLAGVRRLRPGTPVEVYRSFGGGTDPLQRSHSDGLDVMQVIEEQSSSPNGHGARFDYLLTEAAAGGNRSAILAFLETKARLGPMDSDREDDYAEAAVPILLPIRQLRYEVWIHRNLRRGDGPPTSHLFMTRESSPKDPDHHERLRLSLPSDLEVVAAPFERHGLDPDLADRHASLVELACRRLGVAVEDLACYRVQLAFPPNGSKVVIRWPLAHRPG
jgi:hypothetical protein